MDVRRIVLRHPTRRQRASIRVLRTRRYSRRRRCRWGTERMSPNWSGVRSRGINVEPTLVAAKVTLLGMRGRLWSRCVPWVILVHPPSRKRPFVRVRWLTWIRRYLRANRAALSPRRRRRSRRAEGVNPSRRRVRNSGVYVEPRFVAANRRLLVSYTTYFSD